MIGAAVWERALREVMAMVNKLQPTMAVDWSGGQGAYREGHRHCRMQVHAEIERMISSEATASPAMAENLWPDPTPEMLTDPRFEAIWQAIKAWDINVPGAYTGYCGATGNHARAIFERMIAREAPALGVAVRDDYGDD